MVKKTTKKSGTKKEESGLNQDYPEPAIKPSRFDDREITATVKLVFEMRFRAACRCLARSVHGVLARPWSKPPRQRAFLSLSFVPQTQI